MHDGTAIWRLRCTCVPLYHYLSLCLCGLFHGYAQEDVPFFPAQESHLWEVAEQARAAAEALATPSPAAKPKSSSSGSPLGARRSPTPSRRRGRGPPPPPLGKPVLLSQPSPGPKVTVSSGPPPGSLPLTTELVMAMSDDEWAKYSSDVYNYLMVSDMCVCVYVVTYLYAPLHTAASTLGLLLLSMQ